MIAEHATGLAFAAYFGSGFVVHHFGELLGHIVAVVAAAFGKFAVGPAVAEVAGPIVRKGDVASCDEEAVPYELAKLERSAGTHFAEISKMVELEPELAREWPVDWSLVCSGLVDGVH